LFRSEQVLSFGLLNEMASADTFCCTLVYVSFLLSDSNRLQVKWALMRLVPAAARNLAGCAAQCAKLAF
jgi:hypothetical protein